jgi:hypothetical protein
LRQTANFYSSEIQVSEVDILRRRLCNRRDSGVSRGDGCERQTERSGVWRERNRPQRRPRDDAAKGEEQKVQKEHMFVVFLTVT